MEAIEKSIIEDANDLCTKYPRDFPWYDKKNPLTTLQEALAVFVYDSTINGDVTFEQIAGFIKEKFKDN